MVHPIEAIEPIIAKVFMRLFSLSNIFTTTPEFFDLWSLIDSLRFFDSALLIGMTALTAGTNIPIAKASKQA